MDRATVSISDIEKARNRIGKTSSRTPLVYSPWLSRETGAEVYLKLENFQPVKTFKIRGATNKLSQLPKGSEIIAASSGNHGFAVSYVSRILGQRATICVPETANPDKIMNIEMFGATVVRKGTSIEDAFAEATQIRQRTGAVFVHAFEDLDVIAGAGTLGLEIIEELPEVEAVVVPVGGGGLISGAATALKAKNEAIRILGVQPSNAPSMVHAFNTGQLVPPQTKPTIADGLVCKMASPVTFSFVKRLVYRMITVEENEIEKSLLDLLNFEHMLVEPSGAATTAALLFHKQFFRKGEKIAVVISGGNISIRYLKQLINTS